MYLCGHMHRSLASRNPSALKSNCGNLCFRKTFSLWAVEIQATFGSIGDYGDRISQSVLAIEI